MALVAAATLVAELGDITRFANPRQLMAYLGLVPSEHSSGGTRRQGGIAKAGNGAARRMLIEAAWSYRFPARISRELLLRQEGLAKPIRDTAWKAQERLCRRYRKLARAGKPANVATAAIARELAGFVWAIAKQAQPPALPPHNWLRHLISGRCPRRGDDDDRSDERRRGRWPGWADVAATQARCGLAAAAGRG